MLLAQIETEVFQGFLSLINDDEGYRDEVVYCESLVEVVGVVMFFDELSVGCFWH